LWNAQNNVNTRDICEKINKNKKADIHKYIKTS